MIQQQGQPTVGDTVTILHRVAVRPGAVIDARAPVDSAIATLIAPPVLTREGDSVTIAYTVAVWTAGHNEVLIPGAVLVDERGHVDTLPDTRVYLDVRSTLPTSKSPGSIKPQDARPWLPRADQSMLPFLVILPVVLALLGVLQWWWRRRGPEAILPTAPEPVAVLTDARVQAWIAAGESRLVLEHLDAAVRGREDFAEWRERVAAVRFAAGDDAEADRLATEAWARFSAGGQ